MTEDNEMESFVIGYMAEAQKIIKSIDEKRICEAIRILNEARKRGNAVYTIGNGGSAGTASHFAADLEKWATGGNEEMRFQTKCLCDNVSQLTALFNDLPKDELYAEQLKTHLLPEDVVVAFSVHGGKGQEKGGAWSQNLTKAVAYAKENRGYAIGFTGFDGGALEELCDVNVLVPYNSTPHVEGLHVVLHHLVVDALNRIAGGDKAYGVND